MVNFGEALQTHLRQCAKCDPKQYVNYEMMKELIYKGVSVDEFQRVYHSELHKVVHGIQT
eukprot:CAMPEP_0182947932 /NCGR_PEP_ID=MMETSP0105_2-20130417/59405_1 /TAXON_ID=81532 ORGANISM="Acanthoeca-like sp., Strain 10tr" /NCGR_SAMPLE_ID=MMETSP0105_2 /ASSEMBLY_ACC=CAM_ASM_000205 /LENGTH=59 /DNA_ID=CAMNT_0025088211 /DNA_START=56 /DNA_END=231 /DNA_ORIENTATION=-